jgi:hypothetical protein
MICQLPCSHTSTVPSRSKATEGRSRTYRYNGPGYASLFWFLILTYIAVFITIVKSPSRRDGGIWKTSLLASLLHGVGDETKFGDAWLMTDLKSKAMGLKIKLKSRDDGYSFHGD